MMNKKTRKNKQKIATVHQAFHLYSKDQYTQLKQVSREILFLKNQYKYKYKMLKKLIEYIE